MKFSIRDLFLVTLIVALAVALWMQRRQAQSDAVRIEQLTKEAKKLKQRSAVADSLLKERGLKLDIDEKGRVGVSIPREFPSLPPDEQ